jgi:phospholipid transport system transporter-binding protein
MSDAYQVTGELTLHTASRQLTAGLDAVKQGCTVFDLSAITQLDSTALAFILACQRMALKQKSTLYCTGIPVNLTNLATLYGVAPLIFPNL